jgi:hypothetical protein
MSIPRTLKTGFLQMQCSDNPAANMKMAFRAIRDALSKGA